MMVMPRNLGEKALCVAGQQNHLPNSVWVIPGKDVVIRSSEPNKEIDPDRSNTNVLYC